MKTNIYRITYIDRLFDTDSWCFVTACNPYSAICKFKGNHYTVYLDDIIEVKLHQRRYSNV
jgi:hypothetical protein